MTDKGGQSMTCESCFGQVKTIDQFGQIWTVECCSCGKRYNVHEDPNKREKMDYEKIMKQRWAW